MMLKKLLSICTIMMLTVMLVSGCGGQNDKGGAADKKTELKVVTSFFPIYSATLNVTKGVDGVSVVNMTKPQTGCLHDYQLTTEDMKTLEKADVFVVNGAGMESFLDKVIKQQKKLKIVEASRGIDLLKDDEGDNPHVWVSVANEIQQVKNIAAQLSEIDGVHAAQYQKNADEYVAKLTALQQEMHKVIDPLPNKKIITFHEAFPYFAKEFNLEIVDVIEREPGSQPSSKELEATIQKIKASNVKALFAEPQYPADAAKTIAGETDAKLYTLDPVVSAEADASALNAYIDIMHKNMAVLQEALR